MPLFLPSVPLSGGTLTGPLVISGGTVTASTPVLDLSQTWNNGAVTFTAWKLNVSESAANTASVLLDLQRDGTSRFAVQRSGSVVLGASANLTFTSTGQLRFTTDTILERGAAYTLDLKNLANANTLQIYGTTDAGVLNYRRIRTTMTTGGAAVISAEGLGAGVSGNTLAFAIGSSAAPTTVLSWDSSANASIAGDLQFATGSYVKWSGRTKIGGATDGILLLVNNAGSDFGRLQLGGTTSSFPSLKRSTTIVQGRLADDSDFCTIQGKLRTDNAYSAGAPGAATGTVTITDSTGTAYRIPVLV